MDVFVSSSSKYPKEVKNIHVKATPADPLAQLLLDALFWGGLQNLSSTLYF